MKFPLGQIVATPGCLEVLENDGHTSSEFLDRHHQGDWGIVDNGDKKLNDQALKDGDRILSAYETKNGTKIWVITEADRSATTLLLPQEY